jgi:hypothetical protein
MTDTSQQATLQGVAVARAVVTRAATGRTEVHYSYEPVPIWRLGRYLKLHRHLRFMKREDRKAGHG